MWTIVNEMGARFSTNDAQAVKDAIDMGWQVWHLGRRVW